MYTKREMKIHKNSFVDLASAVIRQWHFDGRPRGDFESIKDWAEILRLHQIKSRRLPYGEIAPFERDSMDY